MFIYSTSFSAHTLKYIEYNEKLILNFSLDVDRLRVIVRQLMQFITVRQFSSGDKFLPPLNKSRWWIPSATKLLALISKYVFI